MAKVRGPLLSLGASGQIGGSQVYASWRGVPYARQRVVPANPNTAGQQSTRNAFAALSAAWKILGTPSSSTFEAAARGRPLTARNLFVRTNLPIIRTADDWRGFLGSPGNGGAPPLTLLDPAPAPGFGNVDVQFGVGAIPTGWTLERAYFLWFSQPADATVAPASFSTSEVVSPAEGTQIVSFSGADTGLGFTDAFVVTAWPVFTKPDGTIANGVAITDFGTTQSS